MSDWGVSAAVDGLFGMASAAQQNKYNRDLAEYQNAFNLEMWNKNNEYNSPTATMERLVQAGINPRSYGNLGQFANAAEAPKAAEYSKSSPLAAFSDIASTALSLGQMDANIKKAEAETKTEDAKQTELYARAAGYLTAEDKKGQFETTAGFSRDNIKIRQDVNNMAMMRLLADMHERGHTIGGMLGRQDYAEFYGNEEYFGINNKYKQLGVALRASENWFKEFDKVMLDKYGVDNRTSNWIDKVIRFGGRGAKGIGDYFNY